MVFSERSAPAPQLCRIAEAALEEMATCGLTLARQIQVDIVQEIGASCAGLYDCDHDSILILHPDRLPAITPKLKLFQALDPGVYLESLFIHELVHAIYDGNPCPFETGCVATSEYLAYTQQLDWLGPDNRARMSIAPPPKDKIEDDEINAVVASWSPHLFAVKAWHHLHQQSDPCNHIRAIAAGQVFYDDDFDM